MFYIARNLKYLILKSNFIFEELFILLLHEFTKRFNTEPEKQRIRPFAIAKYFRMQ